MEHFCVETNELKENVMKVAAKLNVAVSATEADELLDFPLGNRRGNPLTLVLYDLTHRPNNTVVTEVAKIKVLQCKECASKLP